MRIISQNRSVSVEFGNGIIKLDGNYIFFIAEHHQEILGMYPTRRAIEVFEEIHKAYSPIWGFCDMNTIKDAPVSDRRWNDSPGFVLCANNNNNTTFHSIDNFVYYMPEE